MKPRIAILASGSGTTAEAFIMASLSGSIESVVELIIVSREDAGIFERINNLNQKYNLAIKTVLINHRTHPPETNEEIKKGWQGQAEEAAILEEISIGQFDLVALMGYMKRLGPKLIKAFGWLPEYSSFYQAKMVNTHPGLLPDTKAMYGLNIQRYVLEHKLPYGGQTLHLVSEAYDDGPIIAEHKVPVEADDTPESLFARVQAAEKRFLPADINDFIKARLAYTKSSEGDN